MDDVAESQREHGSTAGYWQHYRRKEVVCAECRNALRAERARWREQNREKLREKERRRAAQRRADPNDPIHQSKRRAARKAQQKTLGAASNRAREWTSEEDAMVLRPDLSMTEIALAIGRTRNGVVNRRRFLRRGPEAVNRERRENYVKDAERIRAAKKRNYDQNPEPRRRAAESIRHKAQGATVSAADRSGQQWTGPELELLSRDDLSVHEIARTIRRTFYAVRQMKTRLHIEPKLQNLAGQ